VKPIDQQVRQGWYPDGGHLLGFIVWVNSHQEVNSMGDDEK